MSAGLPDPPEPLETPTAALGFENTRDRALVEKLLEGFQTVELSDPVPEGTDICLVDAGRYERYQSSLSDWKIAEEPTLAPVLLLSTASVERLWEQYDTTEEGTVDAILSVPAPRAAIRSRVEGLVEQRRQSVSLQERNRRLRLYERALDQSYTGITIAAADDDQPLLYANDAFIDMTGYDREEVLGRNCRFLQGEATKEEPVRAMREAIEARRSVRTEVLNYRKDGTPFWNQVEIGPVYDDGVLTHFLGFQEDVTERKAWERSLERYERIVETASEAIYLLDEEMRVVFYNEATHELVGSATADPTEMHIWRAFGDDHAARLYDAVSQLEREGETHRTVESHVLDEDGTRHDLQTTVTRSPEPQDDADHIICVSTDVTEARTHQRQLSVLDRVLRHNIRNKLNVIQGRAQMLAAERDVEQVRANARSIEEAGRELLSIANAARRFRSTLDTRTGTPTTQGDVAHIARDVARRQDAADGKVTVDVEAPESMPAVVHEEFELGLRELVSHAVERGAEEISFRVSKLEHHGRESVELRMTDDGRPISSAERTALRRGSESPLQHGSHLSYWLVQWMVESANGSLSVETDGDDVSAIVLHLSAATAE